MIEQAASLDHRRRLLFAGTAVAGVLLGLLLLMALGNDGSDQSAVQSAGGGSTTTTTSARPPEGATAKQASLPVASIPAETRDPFFPVVAVPKARSGQGSQQGTFVSSSPSVSASTAVTTKPSPSGTGYASLELKSINQDANRVNRAEISVDGQTYTPAQGEIFSPFRYRLEGISGSCVEVSAQQVRAQMCLRSGS